MHVGLLVHKPCYVARLSTYIFFLQFSCSVPSAKSQGNWLTGEKGGATVIIKRMKFLNIVQLNNRLNYYQCYYHYHH